MPSKQEKKTGSEGRVKMGNEALSDLAALQAFGFNNMTSFGTAWIEALSDMGSEVLSFVADRIQEDVKTQHEILHCEDIAELQHIHAKFVQKAIDQYTAETGKLVEMSQSLFPNAAEKDD